MKALVAKRIQPTAMLYVTALLRRIFYFQFPKRRNAVNASEVNILLRVSKLSCAARSANVPEETTLNYDAPRPEYTGLSQWRRPIQGFFLVAARPPHPRPSFFFRRQRDWAGPIWKHPFRPVVDTPLLVSCCLSYIFLKKTCHYPNLLSHVLS